MKIPQRAAWIAFALILSISCRKQDSVSPTDQPNLIREAKTFFENNIQYTGQSNPGNPHASDTRQIHWEDAVLSIDNKGVFVPISYSHPQFLTINKGIPTYFSINNVSTLLLRKDSTGKFDATVQLRVPDSTFLANAEGPFSGIIFQETWTGYSLKTLNFIRDIRTSSHSTERSVLVCITIYGYNYAPSDPGAGYAWSSTSCTMLYIPAYYGIGDGGGYTSGDAGGSGGYSPPANGYPTPGGSNRPVPTNRTVRVFAPASIIPSVPDYLHCFSNNPSSTYQVQVCVDQPVSGSRTAWGLNPMNAVAGTNPVKVGHTFLILTQNTGYSSIVRNIGFYPGSDIGPSSGSVQAAYNNDEMHPYNISATFTVSGANFMGLINNILVNYGNQYNLSSNNCTTWALNALDQAHIYLPHNIGNWMGGMGNDPGDLGEDIRNSNAPGIVKSTSEGIHMNLGGCK